MGANVDGGLEAANPPHNGASGTNGVASGEEHEALLSSKGKHMNEVEAYDEYEEEEEETPLPGRLIFFVGYIQMTQAVQLAALFPLMVFMVEGYEIAHGDPSAVGRYAGLLASVLPMCGFVSGFFWGLANDWLGTKPVLIFGTIACLLSMIMLGFAKTYFLAVVARAAGGLFNPVQLTLKTIVGEICDRTNIAGGFAALSLAWGLGTAFGPFVSGMLADPCRQYHWKTCPALLKEYPFLPPFAATAVLLFIGTVMVFFLPETHPGSLFQRPVKTDHVLEPLLETSTSSPSFIASFEDVEEGGRDEEAEPAYVWWKSPLVLLATSSYGLVALVYILHDEVFPIFAAAPQSVDGLELTSSQIGISVSVLGSVQFAVTLFAIQSIARCLGNLWMYRVGLAASIPVMLLTPVVSLVTDQPSLEWGMLLFIMALKALGNALSFTAIMVIINNLVLPSELGAVNGLAYSLASFTRAFGPALGGAIWASSISLKGKMPFHQGLAFAVMAFVVLLTIATSICIPNDRKKKKSKAAKSSTSSTTTTAVFPAEM